MSRIKSITTKQIHADHWDNHECAIIRSMNTDDEECINDQIADVDAEGKVKLRTGRNKRLTLQRAIVSWTLTDEHGKPLPLNEQSIRELHPSDSQYIFDEIQKHNKPLTNDEKKDSTTNVSASTVKAASLPSQQ
jgi:hypothetical protein